MSQPWLVTGGAGYVGAHVARALLAAGIPTVVLDNLSTGKPEFVPSAAPFVTASVVDQAAVAAAIKKFDVVGVIHLAGFKYAGESVHRPLHTYTENLTGMINLLQAMQETQVNKIVFSSSAAVYGTPEVDRVTEETPTRPESPYGKSKLFGEWLLDDQARAQPLTHTSLRYFNVVGSGAAEVYDVSPHNLFPKVFDALLAGQTPVINGTDYPTPDGTNVRDYVHVSDIAAAHVTAAQRMLSGQPVAPVYNLGSGTGVSVREIMTAMARVTGHDFTPIAGPRRPGDPARCVATGELAARDLDWQMRYTVEEMVASAFRARQTAAAR